MARYNKHRKLTVREKALHALILFLAAIAVTLLMPRDGSSSLHYSYVVGEPWDGEDVISRDSFAVPKSEAMLQRERDSISRYYEAYYRENAQVVGLVVKNFSDSLSKYLSTRMQSYETKAIEYIYKRGVMPAELHDDMLDENPDKVIYVYNGTQADKRRLADVFTPESAYEYLKENTRVASLPSVSDMVACISPNLTFDEDKSNQEKQAAFERMLPNMGKPVLKGQKIVRNGDIVDEYISQALLKMEAIHSQEKISSAQYMTILAGQAIFVIIMLVVLYFYFCQFRSDYLFSWRTIALVALLAFTFISLTFMLVEKQWLSVYVLPYCILPIILRIFLDSRTAFITHLFTVLTCSACLVHPQEFIIVQSVVGLTAVYNMRQLSRRSDLVRAVVMVGLASLLTYLSLEMLHGTILISAKRSLWPYIFIVISSFLSLVAYLLLIPIERIFGFTSTVTLVELGDINSPLMRALSEKAPGTFQHSMQVANLAAAAAYSIGAQSQLVRTGALYHDIGKLKDPECFTENQSGYNPHDGMTCLESSKVIISHVEYGLALAEKYSLPKVIREFISTHHGEGMARYFYITYKNEHPDEEIDTRPFTYPGPDPFTTEQALLMMADGVEAASRSLTEYTEESIARLVDKIVDGLTAEGRFRNCPMTLRDIDDAKRIFCEKLKTIYHSRIKYPELQASR